MAEAPRPRPVEYYNPRPLILGICFFWGIAMGFCLFYFAPPKQMGGPESGPKPEDILTPAPASPGVRRNEGIPDIATVTPAPETVQEKRPSLETMELEPPTPILSTEGGLTGRTAHPLRPSGERSVSSPSQPVRRPQQPAALPPIPELMP